MARGSRRLESRVGVEGWWLYWIDGGLPGADTPVFCMLLEFSFFLVLSRSL